MTEARSPGPSLAFEWLKGYRKDWLPADVIAGLTTAAVVVPKTLAFSTIAGVPVQAGLATAFLPAIVYSVLGTSRPMSMSTTTTLAILTAAQISLVDPARSRWRRWPSPPRCRCSSA